MTQVIEKIGGEYENRTYCPQVYINKDFCGFY